MPKKALFADDDIDKMVKLYKKGDGKEIKAKDIKAIAKEMKVSNSTVRNYLKGEDVLKKHHRKIKKGKRGRPKAKRSSLGVIDKELEKAKSKKADLEKKLKKTNSEIVRLEKRLKEAYDKKYGAK